MLNSQMWQIVSVLANTGLNASLLPSILCWWPTNILRHKSNQVNWVMIKPSVAPLCWRKGTCSWSWSGMQCTRWFDLLRLTLVACHHWLEQATLTSRSLAQMPLCLPSLCSAKPILVHHRLPSSPTRPSSDYLTGHEDILNFPFPSQLPFNMSRVCGKQVVRTGGIQRWTRSTPAMALMND